MRHCFPIFKYSYSLFLVLFVATFAHAKPNPDLENFPSKVGLEQAQKYLKELRKSKSKQDSDAAHPNIQMPYNDFLALQVRAKNRMDTKYWWGAVDDFETIIANSPSDFLTYFFYMRSLSGRIEQTSDRRDKKKLAKELVDIATLAHAKAPTPLDKAVVLLQLANSTGNKALKDKALKLTSVAKIKQRIDDLVAVYPLIQAPYKITAKEKAGTGAACITWTHPLKRSRAIHYEDYVAVTPVIKDLAVTVQGTQLCIQGLKYGESYDITLKPGLPGSYGHNLKQKTSLATFIPNRDALVSFREKGYVLPQHGAQILPLMTINVPKVRLKIIRFPQRNLAQIIKGEGFLIQIRYWNQQQLADNEGELVWEGTFDTKDKQNTTRTSGIPVHKVLGKNLKPGLYVALANEKAPYKKSWDKQTSTQWFVVSDIGLSVLDGPDGIHVMARSLQTAQALPKLEFALIAKNNRVLKTATSDDLGFSHFKKAIVSGKGGNQPLFIQASSNKTQDFSLISLKTAPLNMSDRGDKGRQSPENFDVFMYTERGIYRPGETIHLMALLRDTTGQAVKKMPLTFKVLRPDNHEVMSLTTKDQGAGAHGLEIPTTLTSHTGSWTILAYVDPKARPVARHQFQLSDFIPPQIEATLKTDQKWVAPKGQLSIDVAADYLFGTPAQNLRIEGVVRLMQTNQLKQWPRYHFGLEEEPWKTKRIVTLKERTSQKGQASLKFALPPAPQTSHLLEAVTEVSVFEISGRPKIVKTSIPFWHQEFAVGIQPQFKNRTAPFNGKANFNVIAITKDNKLQTAKALNYVLYKEKVEHMWFRRGSQWRYESVITDEVVKQGTLNLSKEKPTAISQKVKSGRYRLEVEDPKTQIATSVRFWAGWGRDQDDDKRPDKVEITLDKKVYKPGQTARLFIKPPFAGELVVLSANKRIGLIHRGHIPEKGKTITFNVKNSLAQAPGAYIYAKVFRPAKSSETNLPERGIGLTWLQLDPAPRTLEVKLDVPQKFAPKQTLPVKVTLDGKKKAYLTITAVDDSILQLTNFTPPDPLEHYYSQQAFAFRIRDLYGRIINPSGARPASFEVGGGAMKSLGRSLAEIPIRSTKIVSLYSGIVEVDAQGTATIPLAIPEFSGRLRLMAVAWNEEQMGAANASLQVHNDVVAKLALPLFLAKGDNANVILDLHNLEGPSGDYNAKFEFAGAVDSPDPKDRSVVLSKGKSQQLPLNITAGAPGVGQILLTLSGPQGKELTRQWQVGVRPLSLPTLKKSFKYLSPGDSMTYTADLWQDFTKESARVTMTLSSFPNFGGTALIKSLLDYPYRCLEQMVSRGFAVLAENQKNPESISRDIKHTIERIFSLQRINGGFGMWSAYEAVDKWLSAYCFGFLLEAQQQKVPLPQASFNAIVNWLKESTHSSSKTPSAIETQAYSHYLLAKAGKGDLSRLRYFSNYHRKNLVNPRECAFVAGAYAYFDDLEQAHQWFGKAIAALKVTDKKAMQDWNHLFFASPLVDRAIVVKLLAETTQNHPNLPELIATLADVRDHQAYLSTQEKAWLLRVSQLLEQQKSTYHIAINGSIEHKGPEVFEKQVSAQELTQPYRIENKGKSGVWVTTTITGHETKPRENISQGLAITRVLLTLEGKKINQAVVKQGQLYVVKISGKVTDNQAHSAMIVDYLPAGLEIEKSILSKNHQLGSLKWLGKDLSSLTHFEARDDRFVAALNLSSKDKYTVAYLVRAVTPGTYTYPAPFIENMYRPNIYARGSVGTLNVAPTARN